jgi:hypothetical protein
MEAFLFYLVPIFAGIAFLVSLTVFFGPPAELYLKLFPVYLLLDCIVEGVTNYLALRRQNTILLSSLWAVLQFCFYIYVLQAVIHRPKAKRILLYCLIAFPLIFIVNLFLVQKFQVFQSMNYCLDCLVVVAACIFYFLEVFQSKNYVNLVREPAFWICSGLLFNCACSFPVYGLINFINGIEFSIIRIILYILGFINILLYLSFTIAFLCRLRTRKSL